MFELDVTSEVIANQLDKWYSSPKSVRIAKSPINEQDYERRKGKGAQPQMADVNIERSSTTTTLWFSSAEQF